MVPSGSRIFDLLTERAFVVPLCWRGADWIPPWDTAEEVRVDPNFFSRNQMRT